MLTLVTGVPGAGKTLWSVSTLDKKRQDEGRDVYYYGIDNVTLEGWTQLDDPRDWYKCPEGALIMLDECWDKLFPARKVGSDVPAWVEPMATHRHRGHDVFVVTQHSTQIDTFVRKMVGQHCHFLRKFGTNRSIKYEWAELANERDKWERKEAETSRFKYPTEYFGKYKSTVINTVKSTFPWAKVAGLAVAALCVPLLIMVGLKAVWPEEDTDSQSANADPLEGRLLGGLINSGPDEYLIERPALYTVSTNTVEVEDIPYSSTFYDALIIPVAFPRVDGCGSLQIGDEMRCSCNDQQGNHIEVSFRACMYHVEHGQFDFTEPDQEPELRPIEDNQGPPSVMTAEPAASGNGVPRGGGEW